MRQLKVAFNNLGHHPTRPAWRSLFVERDFMTPAQFGMLLWSGML